MRIAYITHYADLYGANRSMLDLLLELKRRSEVEPCVQLPRSGALSERLQAEGVDHAVVPWQAWMSDRSYMGGPHHRIGQYLRYERAARERARGNEQALPAVLAQLDRWNVDAIHVNSAAVGITGLLLGKWPKPLIWHIRELPERQYLLHIDAGKRRYARALRGATRLLAISEAVRDDVQRYASDVAVERIYNGVLREVEHRLFAPLSAVRWGSTRPFTFLLAGLIHPSKGQEEAIQALAIARRVLPYVELQLAGDGKAEHLKRLVADLGLSEAVHFLGFEKDLRPRFLSAHVLLMCSRNEAMGRVTVEGMASGLPVIGHASGGTVEIIKQGETGLLYRDGPTELARRMLELAQDPAKARSLGERAMQDVADRFTVERYANEVLEVYRSVLSPPH